jgi:rhodanese-related sulfurtransferase
MIQATRISSRLLFLGEKMLMRLLVLLLLTLPLQAMVQSADLPEKKQTMQGLYLTAAETHQWKSADPTAFALIDIRTPGEFVFVGHVSQTQNIPFQLSQNSWDPEKKRQVMNENPRFLESVRAVSPPEKTLVLMCRSGGRSARAADMLAENGWRKVYSVVDGFEGDKFKAEGDPSNGQRVVNGWKNSNLPWTYSLQESTLFTTP